jgi:membrane-associated phospholipid phosphatase
MNKYLSDLGYQGPNILLILILFIFAKQHIANPYIYAVVITWQFSSHLLNVFIKNTIKAPRPDSAQDPQFANLKPNLSNYLTIHKHYGMPSGHAQAMFSLLIFIALYFQKPWLTGVALLQTLLTLWQRYETHRHSLKQLLAGSLLGSLVGFIFFKFFKRTFYIADADMITVL